MANVNIRVDDTLKRETEGILSELGLSMSAATNLFYKQIVRYGGIPLDLRVERPNAETRAAIKEVQEMKRNPHLHKGFDSVEALFEDLNSDED
jgi:DNA-damage-inducible protein J